ncbi:MAG: hypothetical protein SGJ24_13945 [Chloroflexota bacterium]|nr:hypothetical protein [Chloroflexota bacterium]
MLVSIIVGALVISACGTIATPEYAADMESTQIAQLATADYMTATPIPPTATTAPPATAVPPTDVPAPTTAAVAAAPSGDPVAGQVVFNQSYTTTSGQWACSLCHSISPDELRGIGPGQWNVAIRAETRVEGQSAYEYLHTAIVAPNDFIVPPDASGVPYPANLMPQNYAEVLTEQELEDVIAYLFTLQ